MWVADSRLVDQQAMEPIDMTPVVHYTFRFAHDVLFLVAPSVVRQHLQGGPKNWHHFCTSYLHQIVIDFQHYFTVKIMRKFVITLSLKIPSHLKCVATLPYEMSSVLKATIFVRLNFIKY